MPAPRRVAVVAADAWTALGSLSETHDAMRAGKGAIARYTDGALVADAAVLSLDPRVEPLTGGRVGTPLGTVLSRIARATHDAAGAGDLPRDLVGLYVATGMVDSAPADLLPAVAASRADDGGFDAGLFLAGGFRSIHPLWPLAMLSNVAVGQVAEDLVVRGDHTVLGPEADAGAAAIVEAAEALLSGAVDGAIAAGVSETVGPASLARLRLRGVPSSAIGEGGASLFLEDEAAARARGRPPLARLAGWASTFEASPDGPGPTADAIARAAREALAAAGRGLDDVGVVFVHGTGLAEAEARRDLFGARRAAVATVAPAVAVGDLLAGAAVLSAALAARSLAGGDAPSSAAGRPRRLDPSSVALVLAQGSGGGAAALVLERAS